MATAITKKTKTQTQTKRKTKAIIKSETKKEGSSTIHRLKMRDLPKIRLRKGTGGKANIQAHTRMHTKMQKKV